MIERLRRDREIRKVLRSGMAFSTPVFTWKTVRNRRVASRWCTIVSKKVSKKATERNCIRRRINECVRKHADGAPAGYDIVIIARFNALTVPSATITQAVQSSFRRFSP